MAQGRKRTTQVGVRLTEEEAAVVAALSEETGLSMSDIVRQALRMAYPERFGRPKPRPKK